MQKSLGGENERIKPYNYNKKIIKKEYMQAMLMNKKQAMFNIDLIQKLIAVSHCTISRL